jgi:hypothetical protein
MVLELVEPGCRGKKLVAMRTSEHLYVFLSAYLVQQSAGTAVCVPDQNLVEGSDRGFCARIEELFVAR